MAVPRIALLRTRDFASLEITFANLDVVQGGGQQARLVRSDPNADAFLIINLSPQSFAEEALDSEPGGGLPNPFPLHRARAAGRSRLIFRVPTATVELPYTADRLLDWEALEFVDEDPDHLDRVSRIEAPYRLAWSPGPTASWTTTSPPGGQGTVPIWRARLHAAELGAFHHLTNDGENPPYDISLSAQQRTQIAKLSTLAETGPILARGVELSSLGAWLELEGDWEPPPPLTVESWRHRATMGRDQRVVVVERGNLYPFGHRASW